MDLETFKDELNTAIRRSDDQRLIWSDWSLLREAVESVVRESDYTQSFCARVRQRVGEIAAFDDWLSDSALVEDTRAACRELAIDEDWDVEFLPEEDDNGHGLCVEFATQGETRYEARLWLTPFDQVASVTSRVLVQCQQLHLRNPSATHIYIGVDGKEVLDFSCVNCKQYVGPMNNETVAFIYRVLERLY